MSNNKLYIIGNGFDLHHNLKTSYANFCMYVRENDKELFDFLEGYLDIDLDKDGLWKDFEMSLSTFDYRAFYSDYDYTEPASDKFKLSEMFGVEDELMEKSEMMIQKMRQALYDWLNEIEYPDNGYKTLLLDTNAKYLTFNYTDTLNQLYFIPNESILHIHHSVVTHGSDLIFGHGSIIKEEPMFDNDGNGNYPTSSYANAVSASKMLLANFYKKTQTIIKVNEKFFDNLHNIDEIIVLGHSLNHIDLPYFKYLHKTAHKAKWTISYYDEFEPEKMRDALLKAGVEDGMSFIKIDDITI
ncbi:MAG: bacteriophage abortive infection AbiH family protein [Sphingobacteriia bacterium]|nr:bacteriophage abortive infection AbiH family protein [Sphingobacteriia bacterium]